MVTSFLGPGARFLIVLKLVELHLPPKRTKISPHPWALCLWKPSSFSNRRAWAEEARSTEKEEEVGIVEMMAVSGWKKIWSEQAEAGVEEGKAWIVTSLARPSPVSPQLG